MPILFEFGLGTSLGWKEWVDTELSDVGFVVALQHTSVLKAIVGDVVPPIPFSFLAARSP